MASLMDRIGMKLEAHRCGGVVNLESSGGKSVLLYSGVPPEPDLVVVQAGVIMFANSKMVSNLLTLNENGSKSIWRCQLKGASRLRAYCRFGGVPKQIVNRKEKKRPSCKIGCDAVVNTKPFILEQQSPDVQARIKELCSALPAAELNLVMVTSMSMTHSGHSADGEVYAEDFGGSDGQNSSGYSMNGGNNLELNSLQAHESYPTAESDAGDPLESPGRTSPSIKESIVLRRSFPTKFSTYSQQAAREMLMDTHRRLEKFCTSSDEGLYVGAVLIRVMTQLLSDVESFSSAEGGISVAREIGMLLNRAVSAGLNDAQSQVAPIILEYSGTHTFLHYQLSRERELQELFSRRNAMERERADKWEQENNPPSWIMSSQTSGETPEAGNEATQEPTVAARRTPSIDQEENTETPSPKRQRMLSKPGIL